MSKDDSVREHVSRNYAKAVSAPTGGGCCQPAANRSSCCSAPAQKGEAVKLAGYDQESLAGLPPDSVVNSFGCGNPVAYSGVKPGDVVVDLGSGAGIDILIAGKTVGPTGRVIGVDMTDEMILAAEANIRSAGLPNVEVRKGIIEELPIADASVDWVISNCVINLSPEKSKVFGEIVRVLKPGGKMLVSDIVADDLPDWIRENEILYSSCVAGAIGEAEYIDGLRQAGLVDIEVRDRLVYDTSMLKGLVESELADVDSSMVELTESLGREQTAALIQQVQGKIASISVYARKPTK